jgi:thiol:disulfide interchange protein
MFNSVFRRISLGVLLLMVGTIPALIASEEVKWEKTLEDGMKEAAKTGKPIMLDFYTDW